MEKSKVGSNKTKNSNLSKNNKNSIIRTKMVKTSSREKIMEIEKNAIVRNKRKKLIFTLSTLLLVLVIILAYNNSNKKIEIDELTDISSLNADKYQSEILNLYNRDGQLELFEQEMDRIQSLVGTYVISNSTLKANSFNDLITKLNNEINDNTWVELSSQKSKYYLGKYSIDENGYVKFKFSTKKIEPKWINDKEIEKYIILN